MHLTVTDENGSLVANVETESAFDRAPDGSAFSHVSGHFEPGPAFARVRLMIDRFENAYAAGNLERAAVLHEEIDRLGLRATDSDREEYRVFNVYFQQDALLFAACSAQRAQP